jgi:hypothetical protein
MSKPVRKMTFEIDGQKYQSVGFENYENKFDMSGLRPAVPDQGNGARGQTATRNSTLQGAP